eukprot:TRINITY_DN11981_c0_g2_i1.p1 TRINITY_DN11981_c0_g2~~TRINITY_DN11981_c0_g2_i1.p1  ORF type:complete len:323 (-),score=87.31 TRINITY_DN11981_c0_g2_i1:58-1026(-)
MCIRDRRRVHGDKKMGISNSNEAPALSPGRMIDGGKMTVRVSFRLAALDKTLLVELPRGLPGQTFVQEFAAVVGLPQPLRLKFLHRGEASASLTEDLSFLTTGTRPNEEVLVEVHTPDGSPAPTLRTTILCLSGKSAEVFETRTWSFLPLRFAIPEKFDECKTVRLFRQTDSALADPLDPSRSLESYGLATEPAALLILYIPTSEDMVHITVEYREQSRDFDVDRFTRIAEFVQRVNNELRANCLLCAPESNFKVDETSTLSALTKKKKSIAFVAVDFEEYYKNFAMEKRLNILADEAPPTAAQRPRLDGEGRSENPLEQPD